MKKRKPTAQKLHRKPLARQKHSYTDPYPQPAIPAEPFEAIFREHSAGKYSVELPDGSATYTADPANRAHAIDGDTVLAVAMHGRRGGRRAKDNGAQVFVSEVLRRGRTTFVGTFKQMRDWGLFTPDEKDWSWTMRIPNGDTAGAHTGDKVVAQLTDWPPKALQPEGRVSDVLGPAGENNTEMKAILATHSLPYSYPEEANRYAAKLPEGIAPDELAKREDFRPILTFTVDPADAKDFDDALSYRELPNGTYEVGVHIADVSFYVRPADPIDKEAYARATSIYLVDRTIPMLPERLCNDLCSLMPGVDRYAYSCVFELDAQAQVIRHRITRSVIHSDRRFAYEEAQQVIETGTGDCAPAILKINELARLLRHKRFEAGAIEFESKEVKFNLDAQGKPTGVYIKEQKEANQMIEEFMLLANKTVAQEIGATKLPAGRKHKSFVYRVHPEPEQEKLQNFSTFVGALGYRLNARSKGAKLSQSFNTLLRQVQGKAEGYIISTLAVRSMERAKYTTQNIGHYGLAFEFYTHFTSPIRRYPDLMVHRLLDRYLSGGRSVNREELETRCEHCSAQEEVAARAERDSVKYKQVEYMSAFVGKHFDGIISGVTRWGLYVELNQSQCEGLIPIRYLEDDYYEFDEKTYSLVGERRHRRYRLGDPITIKVARANLEERQLDFLPA